MSFTKRFPKRPKTSIVPISCNRHYKNRIKKIDKNYPRDQVENFRLWMNENFETPSDDAVIQNRKGTEFLTPGHQECKNRV